MTITDRVGQLLMARGLDLELCEKYGVDSSDQLGVDAISIPYLVNGQVVNHKHRTLTQPKKFVQQRGAKKTWWNFDAINDPTLQHLPLIITEGEMDALAAIQAGFVRTVSVPDGAPAEAQGPEDRGTKYSFIADSLAVLKSVKNIVLATDSDEPGVNLMNDLAIRLGRARCRWVQYPRGCKDFNDALLKYGERGIVQAVMRAKWWVIDGLATMSGMPPYNEPTPYEIGIPDFDLWRIRLGDLCVVSGVSSHGKTQFCTEIACRMATKYNWKIASASFENVVQTDMRRTLRRWYGQKGPKFQSAEELAKADQWIEDHFVWISPTEDEDPTLPWVLEHMAAAVVRYGVQLIIIDPWNEIAGERPYGMTATEWVGEALKQMRRFARRHQVHVIIVAHPAKLHRDKDGKYPIPNLWDIEDSRHWYNKPDVGVIVHKGERGSLIRLQKSKHHDAIGRPGDCDVVFNPETARYQGATQERGQANARYQ